MKNTDIISQFFLEHELKFAEGTVKRFWIVLRQFFAFCPKEYGVVRASDVRVWLANLDQSGKAPATICLCLTALKSFYRYCREENLVANDPTVNIKPPRLSDRLPVYLQRDELTRLKEMAKDNLRDRAIIETLYATGVRLEEFINIRLEDINWDDRQIIIPNGKGKKGRIVLFTSECAERLKEYLGSRQDEIPNLFLNKWGSPLQGRRLHGLITGYAQKLGKRITPHTFRHTFAAHLAEKGMPLPCIQDLLGHDNIKNTRIYAQLCANARKKQYDRYQ
ncbi:MAG: hypothetical protein VR69_13580 [Peptococcaceae bacterium BRH_c4b]|nr:MAG: hypothetical protein VR69_13580 [Peptococcaceae bacterium BRH_c4b]